MGSRDTARLMCVFSDYRFIEFVLVAARFDLVWFGWGCCVFLVCVRFRFFGRALVYGFDLCML